MIFLGVIFIPMEVNLSKKRTEVEGLMNIYLYKTVFDISKKRQMTTAHDILNDI